MIRGVDDVMCAGCGDPLLVTADTTECRRYLGENGLLVADINCINCTELNHHPVPGMFDLLRHRGIKVYELNRDAPEAEWAAAAAAGVPVMSIAGGFTHKDRVTQPVVFFLEGEEDPTASRARDLAASGDLIAAWGAGLNEDA
jgi:hypothetical protein